jgi:diaminopimelate decarboxylase
MPTITPKQPIKKLPLSTFRMGTKTASKKLPFSQKELASIVAKHPTPFHIYDEDGIRKSAQAMKKLYSWAPGYKNYFAVKACPNPYILEILKEEGMGADAASLPELLLCEAAGLTGENVLFTSNNTPVEEYRKAREMGVIINLDDINQIPVVQEAYDGGFPEIISFRYNPGRDITLDDATNSIGNPRDSRFGITTAQLPEAYRLARKYGATRFGLHTMIVTNETDENEEIKIAKLMFRMAVQLHEDLGITLDFIDLGGGLGVAYNPAHKSLDQDALRAGISEAYADIIIKNGLNPVRVITECGRFVMAPNGYMVTTVRSLKHTYHNYVGMDASSADLLRACVYGMFHYISVPGKDHLPRIPQRLTGSMCENNDTLTGTRGRMLPELAIGDTVVFHDTGAHGHALGYNYNGKLRHAEILLRHNGTTKQIRRNQTVADYFATLDYPGLKSK